MRTNQEVTNKMIGRWYDIAKKERMIPQPRNQIEKDTPKQFGVEVKKSDKVESARIRNSKYHKRSEREIALPEKPDFKTKDKMKLISSIRGERADYERLSELTELGLSLEAARDLVANEKEIAAVNGMLNEKKKSQQRQENNGVAGHKERSYEW